MKGIFGKHTLVTVAVTIAAIYALKQFGGSIPVLGKIAQGI